MITERAFAASFPDFWQELLPLLTPSCVHLLNVGHEEHLRSSSHQELEPVEDSHETREVAIVSEFAFHLARLAFSHGYSIHDAFNNDSVKNEAQIAAFNLINRYEGRIVLPDGSLNAAELEEGLQLAIRYETFASTQGGTKNFIFHSPIKGCGFLSGCAADIMIGDYLVEVKTVKRTLAGKDIRQLVVYLALGSVSHHAPWQYAGFFNPRRSTFHKFRVDELISLMSGGKSAVDVYADLLDFTCSSDVQLDSVF
ncbi:MAG: hypothetical protein WCW53_14460 [Syntrophales bacterium]|jgi:hypothetical protein